MRKRKPDEKPRKAILYARFSWRRKVKGHDSVERQLDELRDYCGKHDHEIAGEFSDKKVSGKDAWVDRPGMLEAEKATKRGMTFMVCAFDRLFRDADKGMEFAVLLKKKKAVLLSISEPAASLETPTAKLMLRVILAFGDHNREINNARTSLGMRARQANGERMSGEPPYGWRVNPSDTRNMLKDYDEIAVITLISQLYHQGATAHSVMVELNRRGVKARGKKWNHKLVGRIIDRIVAAGL